MTRSRKVYKKDLLKGGDRCDYCGSLISKSNFALHVSMCKKASLNRFKIDADNEMSEKLKRARMLQSLQGSLKKKRLKRKKILPQVKDLMDVALQGGGTGVGGRKR